MGNYLGRSVDKISNVETLDNITFDGSSSYSLTKNSVAFVPSAPQNIILSIDGVVQSGNFTISGSTINFGVAVSSSSVCNFIIHLGIGLTNVPSDSSVTRDKLNLVSDGSNPSLIAKGTSGVSEGYIQLNCAENSHGVKIKSPPHSAGQSYTLTLPQSITNDTFLKTDGSGNLSFASAGKVLQVVYVEDRTNTFTTSSTSSVVVSFNSTNFEASITPTSTSSKILCMGILPMRCTYNGAYDARMGMSVKAKIGSGSYTEIYGDADNASYLGGYDYGASGMQFGIIVPVNVLYSPSTTSAVTFQYQVKTSNSSASLVINRQSIGTSFTLMEIAG
tara:strand:+ start:1258 stop:2256 length:999 start_codon:yes stop_codon:yes gene_type:complete